MTPQPSWRLTDTEATKDVAVFIRNYGGARENLDPCLKHAGTGGE